MTLANRCRGRAALRQSVVRPILPSFQSSERHRYFTLLVLCLFLVILFGSFGPTNADNTSLRLCGDRLIDLMTTLCEDYGGIAKKRGASQSYHMNSITRGFHGVPNYDRETSGEVAPGRSPYSSFPYYALFRKRSSNSICEDRDQSVYCMCCRSRCTLDELLTFCENPPDTQ